MALVKVTGHPLIVICGTTASGKTALAVKMARFLSTSIISADSRQVYKTLDLGTGKDLSDYGDGAKKIVYRGIDIVEPEEIYTVSRYQQDFLKWYEELSKDKVPILCGGSGLYIEAILRQYDIPPVPEDPLFRRQMQEKTTPELKALLEKVPENIKNTTDRSSRKRIIRALEIAAYGGVRSESALWKSFGSWNPLVFWVRWPREVLRQKIRKRLEERLNYGMLEEIETLRKRLPKERFDLLGLEYSFGARYLDGEFTYPDFIEKLSCAIGQFAKRQETYFRGFCKRGISTIELGEANFHEALSNLQNYVPLQKNVKQEYSSL